MKELFQSNKFLINVSRFEERLDDLSCTLSPLVEKGISREGDKLILATIAALKSCVEDTRDQGFLILEEVIGASQNPGHLKAWLDDFDSQIRLMEPDPYWILLTHSVTKGKEINGIMSQMWDNIENVAECARFYINKYEVTNELADNSQDELKTSTEDIPVRRQLRHKAGDFSRLIQYGNKKKLLKRLHQLIDGQSGANVGSVIRKAIDEGYLRNEPTKADFESEFRLIGSWQAIHNYFHFEADNGKLIRAERIVIF